MTKKTMNAFLIFLTCGLVARAHDGGHGPSVSDTGRYGGLVGAVVPKSEAHQGEKATLLFKSELVRGADGTLRVYLYDSAMKLNNAEGFKPQGEARVAVQINKKWVNQEFPLTLTNGVYIGKMPKPQEKPYNIDIFLRYKDQELMSAFDSLD